MKDVLNRVVYSLRELIHVSLLTLFCLSIFAVAGLQIFREETNLAKANNKTISTESEAGPFDNFGWWQNLFLEDVSLNSLFIFKFKVSFLRFSTHDF